MPTIQKRSRQDGTTGYRVLVRIEGHEVLTKTFARLTDAREWGRTMEHRIKVEGAVSSAAQRTTLADALDRYAREVTPQKKGKRAELVRIKVWKRHKIAARFLSRLQDGAAFAEHRDARRAEGVAENTIRLELALIGHLFHVARTEWGMTGLANPIRSIKLPKGSTERTRRLEGDEEQQLLAALALQGPLHAPLSALAIESAARQGELLGLTWAAVDLPGATMRFADTKGGVPRTVPLSPRAIELLKALPRSIDADAPVFPIPADEVQRAFRRACAAAGIENLRFHDLRHEAVSRLFERGLSLPEVAAISGHRTWAMLRRYTHVRTADLVRKLA